MNSELGKLVFVGIAVTAAGTICILAGLSFVYILPFAAILTLILHEVGHYIPLHKRNTDLRMSWFTIVLECHDAKKKELAASVILSAVLPILFGLVLTLYLHNNIFFITSLFAVTSAILDALRLFG